MKGIRSIAALALIALASTAWAQKTAIPRGEAGFLRKAAEHGLAEVDLGRLGQERGMHEEVKSFGARMVADHGKANEELMRLAQSKGVELPTAPDKGHQRDRERLAKKTGPDFDRAYMKAMLEDHRKDVRDFERMSRGAKDADVRDFATRQLTVLRAHLHAAQATYDLSQGSKRTGDRATGSTKP
jgi:putative membrane protein